MKSVGIDIHKRNSYLTVMDGDGSILKQAKITSNKEAFRDFFDDLESPCQIAMESTYSWQWAYDFLEGFDQVVDISVAHPLKTKAIASARIKNDKIDSETLAHLERAGLIPYAYVPPKEIRMQRDLIRYRASLVLMRTQVKNRVHAVLAKNGISKPCSDIFGKKGMEFLRGVVLPDIHRLSVDGYLGLHDCLAALIGEVDERIKVEAS